VVLVYYGLHFTKDQFWEGISFVHWLPLSYLLGPLLFFYVKTTLADNSKLEKWDWLHLLPAVFIVINCLPFTTLTFDQKAKIAHEIVNVTENYTLDFNFVSFEFILYSIYSSFSVFPFYINLLLQSQQIHFDKIQSATL
jgi:carbon starvation protein CstA